MPATATCTHSSCYDAGRPGETERAEAFGNDILQLCIDVGGTITGEHGVGVEKLDHMCVQFQPHELAVFLAVKAAPSTLSACSIRARRCRRCIAAPSSGRAHVHHGQLPHPELPRF